MSIGSCADWFDVEFVLNDIITQVVIENFSLKTEPVPAPRMGLRAAI